MIVHQSGGEENSHFVGFRIHPIKLCPVLRLRILLSRVRQIPRRRPPPLRRRRRRPPLPPPPPPPPVISQYYMNVKSGRTVNCNYIW